MSTIRMDGMEHVLKNLASKVNLTDGEREAILTKAGKVIEESVKERTPYDPYYHPNNAQYGSLKDNIKTFYDSNSKQVFIHTNNAYWSEFLEYGTRTMDAQPFMQDAYASSKDKAERIIQQELKAKLGL